MKENLFSDHAAYCIMSVTAEEKCTNEWKKEEVTMQYEQFIYDKRNDLSNRDPLLRMPYERPW